MLKKINYLYVIFSIFNFYLLSACGDTGGLFQSKIDGEEFHDPQEVELKKYYNELEERKIALGLLRQDGGGLDTPFDIDDIVEAFKKLAFYNEHEIEKNVLSSNSKEVNLSKWQSAINVSVRFGKSVADDQKDRDLKEIKKLLIILSQVTKHKINISQQNENLYVLIASQKEIIELLNEIALRQPEFNPKKIPIIDRLPLDIHCMAMTTVSPAPYSEIKSALVILRSELPKNMRRACIHEEISQSMGLTNDSHLARPSIFNDDDEFATLTQFDQILLQILYDPRLQSGVSRQQGSQHLTDIATDIVDSLKELPKTQ